MWAQERSLLKAQMKPDRQHSELKQGPATPFHDNYPTKTGKSRVISLTGTAVLPIMSPARADLSRERVFKSLSVNGWCRSRTPTVATA